MRERWLAIEGYEGLYEVSSYGRVRALRFVNGTTDRLRPTPKLKSQQTAHMGHKTVILSCGGRKRRFHVHLLVMHAFVGPRPDGLEASHVDGNAANNCVENLIWESHVENEARKREHGTAPEGEANGAARLTRAQVLEIRRRCAEGGRGTQARLARAYGVSESTISFVVLGKRWAHVTDASTDEGAA